jgi:hypothetical protein
MEISFYFAPFYILLVILLLQTIILLQYIWKKTPLIFDSQNGVGNLPNGQPKVPLEHTLISLIGIMQVIISVIAYFMLIVFFFQLGIGSAHININLFPLVLCGLICTLYIIKLFFLSPTRSALIIYGLVILYEIIFIWVGINIYTDFFYLFIPLIFFPLRYIPFFKRDPLLWDYRSKCAKLSSPVLHLSLWIICFIEFCFQFRGFSLLGWI